MARKSTVGESAKGLTLTLRVSPKTKFLMELLARKHRRSVSSLIEWLANNAAEEAFSEHHEWRDPCSGELCKDSFSTVEHLWSPNETERFINLAIQSPDLMTYEEDLIWNVIKNEQGFWYQAFSEARNHDEVLGSWHDIPVKFRLVEAWKNSDERPEKKDWICRLLDVSLVKKTWTDIKSVAAQKMTPEDLSKLLGVEKNGSEIQQVDPPGVQKARGQKKNQ